MRVLGCSVLIMGIFFISSDTVEIIEMTNNINLDHHYRLNLLLSFSISIPIALIIVYIMASYAIKWCHFLRTFNHHFSLSLPTHLCLTLLTFCMPMVAALLLILQSASQIPYLWRG